MLRPGDTFMFAGRLLRFVRVRDTVAECMEGGDGDPMVPAYEGGRLPLTTNLADRVRGLLQTPDKWDLFPDQVRDWLQLQRGVSRLPGRADLLVETFPRGDRWYLVAYCFEGRNAHQTLGMLITKRMERAGYAPLGFVATDYVLGIWSANQPRNVAALFDQDMLGDDLESWLADSSMLKRTFRNVAVIAGLIQRNLPGSEKNRRQVTVNSDLIYEVLRRHQPDHILLRATRSDAASGLIDVGRIAGYARSGARKDRAHGAVAGFAAGGAGAAGDRAGKRANRHRRRSHVGRSRSYHCRSHRQGRATADASDPPGQPSTPANRWAENLPPTTPARPAIGPVLVTAAPIHLVGERLMLDPMGALFWPDAATAGSVRSASGERLVLRPPRHAAATVGHPCHH